MCPQWCANSHPVVALLRKYAAEGCPVNVGKDWTLDQLEAAIECRPHISVLIPNLIEQIQIEAREKAEQGFAKIYKWDELK